MFDLLANSTKRKAMRKAIKELDLEQQIARENSSVIKRAYQDESLIEKAVNPIKNRSVVNKAETTAVDLKNFKNWRTVDSVKSSSPKYVGNPFTKTKFPFYDEDDEGEDAGVSTLGEVEDSKSKVEQKQTLKTQTDIKKKEESKPAIAQTQKSINSVGLIESLSKKKDEPISEKTTSDFTQFEIIRNKNQEKLNSFRDKVTKKIEEEKIKNNLSSSVVKDESENKLKIEVVVPETKKIVVEKIKQVEKVKAPEKKPVNRKPRGKNKRKFDADVISSINWK